MSEFKPYLETFEALIAPMLIGVILLTVILVLIDRLISGRLSSELASFMAAFGLLGGTSGMIAGATSEPIVGAVLTALLGLISSLIVFMFAKEIDITWRNSLSFLIITLVLCTTIGFVDGRGYKGRFDYEDMEDKKYMMKYEQVYIQTLKRTELMELCEQALNDKSAILRCRADVITK